MVNRSAGVAALLRCVFLMVAWVAPVDSAMAADKLVALYSSHAVPYSMPWVAEELGLFKKYDIDFDFVYIPSSSTATAAILGSNVEVGLLGGVGIVNAYASGATDLVFIGSIKNVMTQSILAKPEITRLEQLRGKRVGVTRIGSNTHFFSVQVFRRAGMTPDKDFTFIQTGGDNETLGARRCCRRPMAGRSRWVSAMSFSVPISAFPMRHRRLLRAVR
ncbi:MAG: ABC transporter substrate-binding protein [Candidatus Binatia bacterium]